MSNMIHAQNYSSQVWLFYYKENANITEVVCEAIRVTL